MLEVIHTYAQYKVIPIVESTVANVTDLRRVHSLLDAYDKETRSPCHCSHHKEADTSWCLLGIWLNLLHCMSAGLMSKTKTVWREVKRGTTGIKDIAHSRSTCAHPPSLKKCFHWINLCAWICPIPAFVTLLFSAFIHSFYFFPFCSLLFARLSTHLDRIAILLPYVSSCCWVFCLCMPHNQNPFSNGPPISVTKGEWCQRANPFFKTWVHFSLTVTQRKEKKRKTT